MQLVVMASGVFSNMFCTFAKFIHKIHSWMIIPFRALQPNIYNIEWHFQNNVHSVNSSNLDVQGGNVLSKRGLVIQSRHA